MQSRPSTPQLERRRSASVRAARVFAVAAVAFWTAKALVIWQAGGLDRSAAESPLFLLGLIATIIACIEIARALTSSSSLGIQLLACVGALVLGPALGLALDQLARLVMPESAGWIRGEVSLWATALIIVFISFRLLVPAATIRRQRREAV